MSSYSVEEFAGNGALKDILDALTADGWDDVPTLKMMSAADMEGLKLTDAQRDALELRTYLHDRNLMQYADQLEESGKRLPELLSTTPGDLVSQYGMRRGHVARFVDRSSACGVILPSDLTLPARKRPGDADSDVSSFVSRISDPSDAHAGSLPGHRRRPSHESSNFRHFDSDGNKTDDGGDKAVPIKGIVANGDTPPRLCGLVQPKRVTNDVTPLSILEKIYVQKLVPEHKAGISPWVDGELKLPPPMKASELWARNTVLLLCVRRPGCVMCRAEAHRLYARKSIFDSLGIQLVAILNEQIDFEVKAFWPRYWGGMVLVDRNRDFFKALGGGQLLTDNLCTGFFFNSHARRNWKRATATGFDYNTTGEGTIKGGLYIVGPGKTGVAYQFIERSFGDWAPLEEVLSVCSNLQILKTKPQKKENLTIHQEEDSTTAWEESDV
ncbi:hypothetical protein MPTK1_3g23520 [Marchantia polymorpha subsp. ruderalis]|uniref:Peroxiredoxin-like 2A n=2 Tax=Marchantia polymorpha TaxID=3197 RepID=A0AAF6B405_MARPO|nr:hypothetical protein MARPO_0024s0128 [Marchantia polymorpha]BBN06739.1 hypothetical protein Mp_3g23520 [Marchantia polymorpha subsp. ruderalis]|eukprot:PTQ43638.1 hypothetical protein MARPO_0024s0128 [Marchantia polymorpha]